MKVWLAALRESEREESTEEHIICEDHFLKDDITPRGISEDAIPIMPPYLDGPLGIISPWGADSSEGECVDAADPPENDDSEIEEADGQPGTESESSLLNEGEKILNQNSIPRKDLSLGLLTKRFLEVLHSSPDGVIDLNEVALRLQARKRRVYDITSVLQGIQVVKKQSTNKIKWIGFSQTRLSTSLKQRLQRELGNLKIVEESLDELIKTCAQQLFDLTDNTENTESAYVTHEDICGLEVFRDQTVIAIKAPEETKLEVPTPKEDNIQMHLKGGKGPIKVLTCEVDEPEIPQGSGSTPAGAFVTLGESRIKTMHLHTDAPGPQTAVQSA